MLFAACHPPSHRPAIAALTTTFVDALAIHQLKKRMLGWGCPNGLLFDPLECVILRDTYRSLDHDSIQEGGRVHTEQLLARFANGRRSLEARVFEWLLSMTASPDQALPQGVDVASPFRTHIVPAITGAFVREVT